MGLFDKIFGKQKNDASNQNSNPVEKERPYVEGRGFLDNVDETFHEDGWLQKRYSSYLEQVNPGDEGYVPEPNGSEPFQLKNSVDVVETFDNNGEPHSYDGQPSVEVLYYDEQKLDCKWHENGTEIFDGKVEAPWGALQTWENGRLVSEEEYDYGEGGVIRRFDEKRRLHNDEGPAEESTSYDSNGSVYTKVFAKHGKVYREEKIFGRGVVEDELDSGYDKVITHFLDDGKTIKVWAHGDTQGDEDWYKNDEPYTPSAHELLEWEARKAEEAAQASLQEAQEVSVEDAHDNAITAMPTSFDQDAVALDSQDDLQAAMESNAGQQKGPTPKSKQADER